MEVPFRIYKNENDEITISMGNNAYYVCEFYKFYFDKVYEVLNFKVQEYRWELLKKVLEEYIDTFSFIDEEDGVRTLETSSISGNARRDLVKVLTANGWVKSKKWQGQWVKVQEQK